MAAEEQGGGKGWGARARLMGVERGESIREITGHGAEWGSKRRGDHTKRTRSGRTQCGPPPTTHMRYSSTVNFLPTGSGPLRASDPGPIPAPSSISDGLLEGLANSAKMASAGGGSRGERHQGGGGMSRPLAQRRVSRRPGSSGGVARSAIGSGGSPSSSSISREMRPHCGDSDG